MNLTEWTQQIYDTLRASQPGHAGGSYTREQIQKVLRTAIGILVDELQEGGDLTLADVGRLWVKTSPPRTVQSNLSEQSPAYQIGTRKRAVFRMSERLKRILNEDGLE